MNGREKETIKQEIIDCLAPEPEVKKIVLFGSFVHSSNPHDIDIAVFQESDEGYLSLALKYRKKTRHIARRIPLDIIPLKKDAIPCPFLSEIATGITVYER